VSDASASNRTLAPGSHLLHIGLPKTGTTAVQNAAAGLRGELLAQGVCYPGDALNHGREANALMGRGTLLREAGDRAQWDELRAELARHAPAIGWISYEQIVQSDAEQATRFVDELGADVHVALTVRNYPAVFASAWQQWVKDAGTIRMYDWLESLVGDRAGGPEVEGFWRRNDVRRIAKVWSDVVGPQRVHIVVLDKARPQLLFDAFEDLLGLRAGTLEGAPRTGLSDNRSLTFAEAALVRGVNEIVEGNPLSPSRVDYYRLMKYGAVAAILRDRTAPADEAAIRVPGDLSAHIAQLGAEAAGELTRLGVDVIGDVNELSAGATDAPRLDEPADYDARLVALAITGAVSGAARAGINFDKRARVAHPHHGDLAEVVDARLEAGGIRPGRRAAVLDAVRAAVGTEPTLGRVGADVAHAALAGTVAALLELSPDFSHRLSPRKAGLATKVRRSVGRVRRSIGGRG
jgi:hypothetical protein